MIGLQRKRHFGVVVVVVDGRVAVVVAGGFVVVVVGGRVVVVVDGGRVVDVVVVTEPVFTAPEFGSTISEDSSTASKSEPCSDERLWRSLSFQRLSGAPLTYQELPLSATIAP